MAAGDTLARLHIAFPDDTEDDIVEIKKSPFDIGRGKNNDLPLSDRKVSREHARLVFDDDQIYLIDRGSANGTYLGGERLESEKRYPLSYGRAFDIGPTARPHTLYLEAVSVPSVEKAEPEPEAAGAASREDQPSFASGQPERLANGRRRPPPPTEPPSPPRSEDWGEYNAAFGVSAQHSRLLEYLPPIYEYSPATGERNEFLDRFLLAFEGVLAPLEQMVDNFDLYLDPGTTPAFFLNQLAGWLGLTLDETWPDERQRTLVAEAAELYRRRGTRWSLSRHLAIYAGIPLDDKQIADAIQIAEPEDQPHHFRVRLQVPPDATGWFDARIVDRIIETNKPAHTTYELELESET